MAHELSDTKLKSEVNLLRVVVISTAFLLALLISQLTAPFDFPDGFTHFNRAAEISYGEIIPSVQNGVSGGRLPTSVKQFENIFIQSDFLSKFHEQIASDNISTIQLEQASKIHWSSEQEFTNIAGGNGYPPFLYLPAAAGLLISKSLHLDMLKSYFVATMFNLFFCFLLIWEVVRKLEEKHLFILGFFLLTPGVEMLFGTLNPDGILLALSIYFGGKLILFFENWGDDRELSEGVLIKDQVHYITPLFISLTLMSSEKPPYILLSLFVWGATLVKRKYKSYALRTLVTATLVTFITVIIRIIFTNNTLPHANSSSKQLNDLVSNPPQIFIVIFNTICSDFLSTVKSCIGVFGWLTLSLPNWFYIIWIFLSIALFIVIVSRSEASSRIIVMSLIVAVGASCSIIIALYLQTTPYKSNTALGMQGRYLLPIFPPLFSFYLIQSSSDLLRLGTKKLTVMFVALFLVSSYASIACLH